MFYTCQVCGQQFEQKQSCLEHEKDCFNKHQTAIQLTAELNAIISLTESKNIKFGVTIVKDGKAVFCKYDKALFDVKNNSLNLSYIAETPENNEKSPKKS